MSGSTKRKDDVDGDSALRELVSAILRGRYTEETYLADVSSVCRARPASATRLLSMLERHRRTGRLKAAQYQRIKSRVDELVRQQQPAGPRAGHQHSGPNAHPVGNSAGNARGTGAAASARGVEQGVAGFQASNDTLADDADEDCPTSELSASTKDRRPTPLTQVLKPAEALTKIAPEAAPLPSAAMFEDEQTRIIPPSLQPERVAAPPLGGLEPEPAPQSAETRVLPTRSFLGPTQSAPHTIREQAGPQAGGSARAGAASAASGGPMSIDVGTVLQDRYELQQLLGRGGIATVYKAVDRYRVSLGLEDCHVAVKIVQPHPSRPGSVAALGREFHNAQLLSHPNVINVFNIDHAGDASFYTMELLDGERLSQIAKRVGLLPRRHALAIIRDIGAAVAHAHSRGVVHADLKPHNIMITQVGTVRVLDFGSGIIRAREPWISELSPSDSYRQATPAYASCEQLEGWSADPRDDIYALACVAYLLLAGRHPFNLRPSLEARAGRLRPRRPPGLSGESWRALQRGLAWSREERTMPLEDWLRDLGAGRAADSLPPLALLHAGRPAGVWLQRAAAASVVIAALGLAAFTVEHQDEFDWQSTLNLAQNKLHGAWQSLTYAPPDDAQPAVSLPPIPPPTPVVTQKSIRDLPTSQPPVAAPGQRAMPHANAPLRDHDDGAGPIATANAGPVGAAPPTPETGMAASAGTTDAAAGPAGEHRLEFSSPSYVVAATEPAARIVVRRSGSSTDGDINFIWWTEEGSARADVDYASLGRRVERIPSGLDKITIYVPLISSSQRRETNQFYVEMSETGQHNDVQPSRSVVTIDNGN